MVEGKQRDDWVHTAVLLTKMHNLQVTSKSDAQSFEDNYPFAEKKKPKVVNNLGELKSLWLTGNQE